MTADPEDLRVLCWMLRALPNRAQGEMAAAARIDPSTLSRYETGHTVPARANVERLAAAAGVPSALLDAVLLPAIRAARLASQRRARWLQGRASIVEKAAEALTEAVGEAMRAAVGGFAAELDAAEAARGRMAAPADDRKVQQADLAAVERLCAESERAAAGDAALALELASLAVRIAEVSPGGDSWQASLKGYALPYVANARRVGSDLDGAEAAFGEARRLRMWTEARGSPELLPEWRLLDLEASLLRERRRFPDALAILDRARAAAPPEQWAHILLNRAFTLEQAGEVEAALAALREAAPLADTANDPRLACVLRFNLAANLCHLGRHKEAAELLPEICEVAARLGNELDLVRERWLSGRIWAGLGRMDEARAAFEQARREFGARGDGYDAALVSLEIAVLDLEAGRTAEVRAGTEEMLGILRSHGLHREAMAAFGLFCRAVAAERATPALARRVLEYMERARHDPRARFEEGR